MSEEHTGEVQAQGQTGEVSVTAFEKFSMYLQQRAEVEMEIVRQQLETDQLNAILSAETDEELDRAMELAGLTGLRDLPDGTEIQINSFHVAPGNRQEFASALGVFAVIEAQFVENGVRVNLDTSIVRVLGFLRMCEVRGRLPIQVRIAKTGTGGGNEMITLLPLRKRAMAGHVEASE
jgi:hypothetical protein